MRKESNKNTWNKKYNVKKQRKARDGYVLRLPLRVGDKVWDNDFGTSYSYTITGFSFGTGNNHIEDPISENELVYYFTNNDGDVTGSFPISQIGKKVFLTEEEAKRKCHIIVNQPTRRKSYEN